MSDSHDQPLDVPEVSILVVAYNSQKLIERCIEAVAHASQRTRVEILFVDNGDGGSQALVEERFPYVRIITSQGNIGFARGNNLLAEHACAPYLLLLNPDMFLCEEAIDILVDAARRHSEAAAWGGVTMDDAGQPDVGNAIAIPSLLEFASAALGHSLAGHRASHDYDQDRKVRVLSGGFVMLSREAWDEAGGLDGKFFLYCEEVDLFYRLERQGYDLWHISHARAMHEMAHGDHLSARRLLYRSAGTMQFLRKHWSPPARFLGAGLLWLAAFERYFAGKLLGRLRPDLARLGEAYRLMATRPELWLAGYDPQRGLTARLSEGALETGRSVST
ncbi:glycosyltransferase family 2 protein [Erythrobacter alti]|uniref:glycosyltransferase family 2 protein n=1 Tax=Erythrobacter alti TaxID=1896145 RepID=UPI0030F42788